MLQSRQQNVFSKIATFENLIKHGGSASFTETTEA